MTVTGFKKPDSADKAAPKPPELRRVMFYFLGGQLSKDKAKDGKIAERLSGGQLVEVELQYEQDGWDEERYGACLGDKRQMLERLYGQGQQIVRTTVATPDGNASQTLVGYKWNKNNTAVELIYFNVSANTGEREDWRRHRLHRNHTYLRTRIAALGYNVEHSHSQIVSLEPGETRLLLLLRDALESRGVFGSVFYPPATPDRRCLIRFTLNCNLTTDELDHVVRVCRDIREEVRMPEWRSTLRMPRATKAPSGPSPSPLTDSQVRVIVPAGAN